MPFQKGNNLAKGGKRNPPGGRPTKEQADFKSKLAAAVDKEVSKRVGEIAKHYANRAVGESGDKVLTHLIDRAIPAAKQEISITGKLQIVEVFTNVDD